MEDTLEKIRISAENETPKKQKSNDPDYRSCKDVDAFIPIEDDRLRNARFTGSSDASYWSALANLSIETIKKIARIFAQSPRHAADVEERLVREVQRRLEPPLEVSEASTARSSHLVQSLHDFTADCLQYARNQRSKRSAKSQHDAKDVIRAIAVERLSKFQLHEIQVNAEVPDDEAFLTYGKFQRHRGHDDYRRIIEGDGDGNHDGEDNDVLTSARVSEAVIEDAVAFVVDKCNFLSWGVKKVFLDGETVEIPKLTRQCVPEEMWGAYERAHDKEKSYFHAIVGFEVVSRKSDKYKGSAYNLKIQWRDSDGSSEDSEQTEDANTTWEPLAQFSKDDPVSCAVFGFKNGLMEERGWRRLQRCINDRGQPNEGQVAMRRAFRGGRAMMQRTAFLSLVCAVTAEDEKLVTAVDYVKGNLVLDPVDVVQRIINDHVESNVKREGLTKSLTVLTNFLKNQYKHHVFKPGGHNTGTHGAEYGLRAPSWPKMHYSEMNVDALDSILEERGILYKRSTSKIAKVRCLRRMTANIVTTKRRMLPTTKKKMQAVQH